MYGNMIAPLPLSYSAKQLLLFSHGTADALALLLDVGHELAEGQVLGVVALLYPCDVERGLVAGHNLVDAVPAPAPLRVLRGVSPLTLPGACRKADWPG